MSKVNIRTNKNSELDETNKEELELEKELEPTHSIYRDLVFKRFIIGLDPVLNGLDKLNERNDIDRRCFVLSGERDGDFVIYKMLYTKHNLDVCLSYKNDKSEIIVAPDSGLHIK